MAGLGSFLSRKHFPDGRANLLVFNKLGFTIGFAGATKPPVSSDSPNGKPGSILDERVSDTTRLAGLSPLFLGCVVTSALESVLSCPSFQRSHADMPWLETVHGCAGSGILELVAFEGAHGPLVTAVLLKTWLLLTMLLTVCWPPIPEPVLTSPSAAQVLLMIAEVV